ncbi:MAG: Protein up-regulated by thyroid hormone-putative PQQ-dependent glucose dehydrogenase [Verrucomicrobiales bacterium]|nr:Protein up-regulated by thyroid hormone-putative PQQ-dependent glucose dehydrogenase [Verrucomicrobiales bacterium]MDB6131257.1 Protein up-regulated by thyroid hormone-putative PQQ-dependent glucose dehydrogenase [Verrucomicrobiales bacterium]
MNIVKNAVLIGMALASTSLFAADALPRIKMKPIYPNIKFVRPLWFCEANDGSGRFFYIEQDGQVFILPRDKASSERKLFLDLSDRKPHRENEEGLLGFALHPDFKTNGKFYVYYSAFDPRRTVISEFQVSKQDPDKADPATERVVLTVAQPYGNHKGGTIIFGPDKYLYCGYGDGGAGNDPHGNGQKMSILLAKVIRIDVNSKDPGLEYSIPKDNPFVGKENARGEIWALGVRNPWRMSFDTKTGLLYAGEVGQDLWEEVDIIEKGGNYGWNIREAFHPFQNHTSSAKFVEPLIEYPHKEQQSTNHLPGLSITGGYVYHGKKVPALEGVYLYADWATGNLFGLRYENNKVTTDGVLELGPKIPNPVRNIAAFGQDNAGEVYVLAFDGHIYELAEDK